MPSYSVTVSSAANSQVVPLSLRRYKQGVGLLISFSSGATLTATLQVTGDNVQDSNYTPASGHWINHGTLHGLTANATGNLAFPVTALRLVVTSYTSGSVTLCVVQAED